MTTFNHLLVFTLALGAVWILSGFIIGSIDRVAKRYNKPGFAVAFFVLGIMTSISEMSVAVNSSIEGVPSVSAGNLVGASVVIFFLIIPLLAISSGSIDLNHTIRWSTLLLALCVVAAPAVVALDGMIQRKEGILLLLLYGTLIYYIRKKQPLEQTVEDTVHDMRRELIHTKNTTLIDILYICGGAVLIFLAGNMLVDESIYFTSLLGVPASLAGLLVLSIGTNTPELILAMRSVLSHHTEIAFGDYLGSAAANTVLFGFLPLVNGPFLLDAKEFAASFFILTFGLCLFALFARTKNSLSRGEGSVLLVLYVCFFAIQIGMIL